MPPKEKPYKSDRIYASGLGEYYRDVLKIEATLKQRTEPIEAGSLLCAKLQERAPKREAMVQYMADKRGISFREMWNLLLNGEPLSAEEISGLEEPTPKE